MVKRKLAVIGAGQFGRNHCRAVHESERAELVAVVDADAARAAEHAAAYGARAFTDFREALGLIEAAVVAAPTTVHEPIGRALLESGIDVLVEKPIAPDLAAADRLIEAATRHGRILQVGHLERFNPAVIELERRATLPLFFEIHRLNVFSPRSLDVDVVLDLMIHDVDIVLSLARAEPRRSARPASRSFPKRWISPTCACNSPTAAWRTSPPAASRPNACASCAFSSRRNTCR